jgi:hypothetical protein
MDYQQSHFLNQTFQLPKIHHLGELFALSLRRQQRTVCNRSSISFGTCGNLGRSRSPVLTFFQNARFEIR